MLIYVSMVTLVILHHVNSVGTVIIKRIGNALIRGEHMAKNTRLRTYSVGAIIKVWSNVDIQAESYEDAVTKAKGLDIGDFITVHGEHNDSNFVICQIDRGDLISTDLDS